MCAVHHVNFDLPIITFTKPVMILLGRLLATTIKWKYLAPKRGSEKMLEIQMLLKMKNLLHSVSNALRINSFQINKDNGPERSQQISWKH